MKTVALKEADYIVRHRFFSETLMCHELATLYDSTLAGYMALIGRLAVIDIIGQLGEADKKSSGAGKQI